MVGTAPYFVAFGAAGAGAAAGVASVPPKLGLAEILPLPCVPLSVPAFLTALYFSTHSRMVSACAGAVTTNAAKIGGFAGGTASRIEV